MQKPLSEMAKYLKNIITPNIMDELHTAYYNCYDSIKPRMPVSKQFVTWLNEKINLYKNHSL